MSAPFNSGGGIWRGAVDVAGGIIRLAVVGAGSPIILLHGWTLDHRMWQPQIEQLARDFTLIVPDRRGSGRSSAVPDLAREADDLDRIADFVGIPCFSLIGLSQGAAVALEYARTAGSRVEALIASGAPLPCLSPRAEVLDLALYQSLARGGNMPAMRADWATHPLMQVRSAASEASLAAMLADYDGRDLLAPSTLPDLTQDAAAALAMPVLAMTGEHDTPWRKACARALADAAPHGQFALVEQAGHLANLDNPDRFNAIVGNFLHASLQQEAHK
jgi:pimeloyl-ACP methyl ester carboxylesterase